MSEQQRDDLAGVVARLADDEPLDRRTRAGLVGRLALLLGKQSRRLVDVVIDVAPHIPIRDLPTLREHYRGLTGDALAEALIANATRLTGTIGAAGGLLSTVELAAPPVRLTELVRSTSLHNDRVSHRVVHSSGRLPESRIYRRACGAHGLTCLARRFNSALHLAGGKFWFNQKLGLCAW